MENIRRIAVQLVDEIEAIGEVKEANTIDFGVVVEVRNTVKKGVKKLIGLVYDYTADKSTVWVETTEDIYKVKAEDVKVVPQEKKQPKGGFNAKKTKLSEQAVRDIFLMATTTKSSHRYIANWVLLEYGIEIVPKTVSDIKLGKRWKKLGLLEGGVSNE